MPQLGILRCLTVALVFVTCLAASQPLFHEQLTPPTEPSWSFGALWQLPLFSWFSPRVPVEHLSLYVPAPPPPPCLVEPMSEVVDSEALKFETAAGTDAVINTIGLTAPTAQALTRFHRVVTRVGGRLELK